MKAKNNNNESFTIELSVVELHIIMRAMSKYEDSYYGVNQHKNEAHKKAAELLHEELRTLHEA